MFASLERVPSKALDTKVHLWRFGSYGAPLLVFPSAAGMAHEWEYNGLVGELSHLIEAGKLKLYCTESNVSEAWTNQGADPAWCIKRHRAFDRYVISELVPLIRADCRTPSIRIGVAGTSLGAYYSANFALRFPDLFPYALCLSGKYDARALTDGFDNEDVYLSNPMAYVPDFQGPHLDRVRRLTHLDLICGQGSWEGGNVASTKKFAGLLESKGISHKLDLWGRDVTHEWTWWNQQARQYLDDRLAG